jgi:uncharacterized protein
MADWRGAVAHYISGEAKPVDKYSHQPRLYALTQQIGASLLESSQAYDDDVVYAAAWLHDLGVFVGHRPENPDELAVWNHVAYTVARAPGLLRGFGFPPDKIVPVLECIENHQPADEPKSIESTILRDADILEQLGAIGIARTVCKVGRDTRFHTFADAAASLTRALETLPGCIRLPVARQLAVPRIDLLRTWLNALHAESGEHLN